MAEIEIIDNGPVLTEEDFKGYANWLSPFMVKLLGVSQDNIVIEPNSDKTIEIPFNEKDGMKLSAYRQISIEKATKNGTNEKKVILRSFSSAGQGTKANISLVNLGGEQAKVKVTITALFTKAE